MNNHWFRFGFCLTLLAAGLDAQQVRVPSGSSQVLATYILAPGDQLSIKAANAEEFNDRTFRIDSSGSITVPLAGTVKAAGLTAAQLEADLVTRLKVYFREPQVTVSIVQGKVADPVFLVGQFKSPGLYALQPHQTLLQVLTDSGGLQTSASHVIRLTRHKDQGPISLPAARTNMDGSSTVDITLSSLRNNPSAEDLVLQPFDTILVDRAEVIYVNGDVAKPGTVELGDRDFVSLIQVVSLSGGLTKDASRKVRILRPIMDTARRAEIEIDLDKVYRGETNDFPLLPNDVLFVPRSGSRVALGRTAAVAATLGIALATSLAIGLR